MKKKKLVLVIIALILLLVVGYTFSKFNQTYSGRATMQTAKWVFNVTTDNNKPITSFSLNDENGTPLLPGSSGSFKINVDAIGAGVNIRYHAVVTNENFPESMIFYMADQESSQYEGLTELLGDKLKGEFRTPGPQSATYIVCWEWPEYGNDAVNNSTDMNYGFDLDVIGEQI